MRLRRNNIAALSVLVAACGSADSESAPLEVPYCEELHDGGRDGSVDVIVTAVFEDGLLKKRGFDVGADQTIDAIETSLFDANGNRTERSRDNNLDRVPDKIERWSFDSSNNETSFELDENNDGVPDLRRENFYDSEGAIERTDSYDREGLFSSNSYTFDSEGRTIRIDSDDPSGFSRGYRELFYEDDLLVREEEFLTWVGETRINETIFYLHNNLGQLTSEERRGPSGIDMTDYRWDSTGRLVTIDHYGPNRQTLITRTYDCLEP